MTSCLRGVGGSSSKTLLYMVVSGVGGLVLARINGWWTKMGMMSDKLVYLNRMSSQVDDLCQSQDKMEKMVLLKLRDLKVQMEELQKLSSNIGKIEGVVSELKPTPQLDTEGFRQLVDSLRKELKRNDVDTPKTIALGNYELYALEAAGLLALIYFYMYMKGMSTSDVVNGTKRGIARVLSSITKGLGLTSATVTEKLKDITEQLENRAEENEQRETPFEMMTVSTVSETSKLDTDAEYLSFLYKLVIDEGNGLVDDDCLQRAFDYLYQNRIAARGFISKRYSNMRKKWLKDFEKRCFEENMDYGEVDRIDYQDFSYED